MPLLESHSASRPIGSEVEATNMADEKKERTFHVYRRVDGVWTFWFNGRGKSAKDMHRRVAWIRRNDIARNDIRVDGPTD